MGVADELVRKHVLSEGRFPERLKLITYQQVIHNIGGLKQSKQVLMFINNVHICQSTSLKYGS